MRRHLSRTSSADLKRVYRICEEVEFIPSSPQVHPRTPSGPHVFIAFCRPEFRIFSIIRGSQLFSLDKSLQFA